MMPATKLVKPLRIAAAQSTGRTNPSGTAIRQNAREIRHLMSQAREAGARLIHFPEGALSGYPDKYLMCGADATRDPKALKAADWTRANWTVLREELATIIAWAGELEIWVVLGAIHPLTPPHWPHNSLYVISDRGEIVTRYDKRLISHAELSYLYTPGRTPIVMEIDGFKLGLALCIEVNFPELFIEYAQLGVDGVLYSAYAEDPMFAVLAQGHAAANNLWLSVSAPAQYSHTLPSGLIGPHGFWLAQGPTNGKAAITIADLNRDDPELDVALTYARPWRRQTRNGLHLPLLVADPRSDDRTEF